MEDILFIYHFSIYLVSTCCGPGTEPNCIWSELEEVPSDLTLQLVGGFLSASGSGGEGEAVKLKNFSLHSKFYFAIKRIVLCRVSKLGRSVWVIL